MKIKTQSKVLASILTIALFTSMFSGSVLATDLTGDGEVNSSIDITGTVTPVTITATVPTAMTFAINPNNATSVTTTTATILNNSKVGINVDFIGFKAVTANTTKVVLNTKYADWSKLGTTDTQSNIALALVEGVNTYWSPAEPVDLLVAPAVGTINLDAKTTVATSKTINLDVKTGNAWTKATTLSYQMTLRIKLA